MKFVVVNRDQDHDGRAYGPFDDEREAADWADREWAGTSMDWVVLILDVAEPNKVEFYDERRPQ